MFIRLFHQTSFVDWLLKLLGWSYRQHYIITFLRILCKNLVKKVETQIFKKSLRSTHLAELLAMNIEF
jgi:hypothetical protein